tara:strand:- start:329 stop:553 length:225 start_codon:yes stop_codon:yes gene_type:complete
MKNFIFLIKENDNLIGYDITHIKKKIINYNLNSGIYLTLLDEENGICIKDELIPFLYEDKMLYIRKKSAIDRKI